MNRLTEKLSTTVDRARRDAEFQLAARGLGCSIGLMVTDSTGPASFMITSDHVQPVLWLEADAHTWTRLMDGRTPGYHSFGAVSRLPDQPLRMRGGTELHQAQSLYALERFFELLRNQGEQPAPVPDAQLLSGIRGQYDLLSLPSGISTPVYWEHAGNKEGPLLLMLHTAGADSRQFHPLMCSPELVSDYQLVSFDLPGHGRSQPLPADLWADYQLSKSLYLELCHAFILLLTGLYPAGNRPQIILLGCSMGAAMALYYARHYPEQLCAVLALEPPFRATGRLSPYLAHPAVNQSSHNAAYVRGLMSPDSPSGYKQLATWIYAQAGFGIYAGDLHFYSEQFDAQTDLAGLTASHCPVLLFSGHYDYSASPADVRLVAECIEGARVIDMPDLGHFPMLENPPAFLRYLLPELAKITTTTLTKKEN